jgi:hypothetical protein
MQVQNPKLSMLGKFFFYVQEGILKAANEVLQQKVTMDR